MLLCKLHSFRFDNNDAGNNYINILQPSAHDKLCLVTCSGGICFSEDGCPPVALIGNDLDSAKERLISCGTNTIQQRLKRHVKENGLQQPLLH